MAFTGTAVISQVSDRIVRVTGLSLAAGQSGSIALHGGVAQDFLGMATTFAILARSLNNDSASTVLNGDLGYINAPAVEPTVSGDTHANDAVFAQAVADLTEASTALLALPATFAFLPGNINLSTDVTHGTPGVFAPGVYDISGEMIIDNTPLTLLGQGRYVFRSTGVFTVNESVVCAGGADPNDVWWIPNSVTFVNASFDFVGNLRPLAQFAVSVSQGVTWEGRILATTSSGLGGSEVTTEFDTTPTTITVPEGLGDTVFLPASFQPTVYTYGTNELGLQDIVQCTTKDAFVDPGSTACPIAIVKSGTTLQDFLITLTNTGAEDSVLQEITIRLHD